MQFSLVDSDLLVLSNLFVVSYPFSLAFSLNSKSYIFQIFLGQYKNDSSFTRQDFLNTSLLICFGIFMYTFYLYIIFSIQLYEFMFTVMIYFYGLYKYLLIIYLYRFIWTVNFIFSQSLQNYK